jgi:hypothetical protein
MIELNKLNLTREDYVRITEKASDLFHTGLRLIYLMHIHRLNMTGIRNCRIDIYSDSFKRIVNSQLIEYDQDVIIDDGEFWIGDESVELINTMLEGIDCELNWDGWDEEDC